ncbi:hypothetical protein BCR33DRAFT_521078 [Rhizoclosmatium globosum]|uniref:Uncharacterized protein n=1 Tax=Rhizoclosmatium globosum TaxID=329046 RepID=A0A1Y2BEU8_9FUNG|nr:hypothetical protein BCR33DRAFT_521078 [Rhizoclosmatium globosum]|eukprot:ORY33226.1 hypothetical protein BCR33DRAFT_521078 [Rhizoclosmatium globosum]
MSATENQRRPSTWHTGTTRTLRTKVRNSEHTLNTRSTNTAHSNTAKHPGPHSQHTMNTALLNIRRIGGLRCQSCGNRWDSLLQSWESLFETQFYFVDKKKIR